MLQIQKSAIKIPLCKTKIILCEVDFVKVISVSFFKKVLAFYSIAKQFEII